jgi:hypothetical protein
VTRNFDFEKLKNNKGIALWLNQYGNAINQSIQDGLQNSTDITGRGFKQGSEFTRNSKHDGKSHKKPLIRSGRLKDSIKKLPATATKLTFIIKSSVKSKARWNVEYKGKKSSGTRSVKGINYGAVLNQGLQKTSKDSLIPNKLIKFRNWFGIPSKFLVGGKEWKKYADLIYFYINSAIKAPMKEHK